jgi:hypothetical protein
MNQIYMLLSCLLNSVGIATGYGLDTRGSIPGKGKRFFSTPQRPDMLWGSPSLLLNGYRRLSGRGLKLTTDVHLVLKSRIVDLYLHSPIRIYGTVLN